MHLGFQGEILDEPEIRAGFIGCGKHSFRNIYPTFQWAPVDLIATCDFSLEKAQAYAKKFGAQRAYDNHLEMLDKEELDAVFIVVGYDAPGNPLYPPLAIDCLNAGCHVWIEKPPANSTKQIEAIQEAEKKSGKQCMVGFKKMFFPANEKAKELADEESFGPPVMSMLQYPTPVPSMEDFDAYLNKGERIPHVVGFLDHVCHPVSLLLYLMGMPTTMSYERARDGSGVATFRYEETGAVASLALTGKIVKNGGMERTTIISENWRYILVENNTRVSLRRNPGRDPEGTERSAPSFFYTGPAEQATAVWEPDFSIGQYYNKGLFHLGYYGEVNEFARAILEGRKVRKCHTEHAWQATRIFEGFAEGSGKTIELNPGA